MASSGMEVRWAGPGLGKGPQRRRWAWAKEKNADGSSAQGWKDNATNPELLEDFRQAQQHLSPLEWDPDPQGLEESLGAGTEAEDVDSPESSTLPLPWLPRQDGQLDVTGEEPNEAGNPKGKATGESSPSPGCEAALLLEDEGDASPMALGWGQATGWGDTDQEARGNGPSEPPEVHRSAEVCLARSWSSGTVSLGHPSDSLDSTWEEETDIPQPTALRDALPQSPHHHHLPPDDRTRGGVALATPMEFQYCSALPVQSPLHTTGRGERETTGLSSPRPKDQTWKQTKTSVKPLPSRFTGSISPLNPQPRPAQKNRSQPRQGATLASHSSSDAPKYGRGRLNYPLPDFSKVGPRVRFPKDESYRPPKSKGHNQQPQVPTGPLIFKSPAEIVREVLLSGGEAKEPPADHPITRIPQEFQTPEQATELVHQLQEDYCKLLTKYAEAENTIDQLRLGAKVNLYSDLPQPSHSIHMGMVPQGTKVLSFTIPRPHSAEWWPSATQNPQASAATGRLSARGDLSPSSPPSMPTSGWLPDSQGATINQPSAEWTQALASQASQLLAKVKSFEGLMQAGCLTPQDQLQSFQQLRATHAALEDNYLQAYRGQHLAPQHVGPKRMPGDADPCRELEAEINQLGIRLEELKDHMDRTQREPELPGPNLPWDSGPAMSLPNQPACLPTIPAIQTLYPQPTTTVPASPCLLNVEVSPHSSGTVSSPLDVPGPLRDKELQMEQDFHGLLDRYISVKSLPEALRMEEKEEEEEEAEEEKKEGENCHILEVDGPASAPGRAGAARVPPRQHPAQAERSHRAPLQEAMEPPAFQTSVTSDRYMPGRGKAEAAPSGPGILSNPPDPKSTASHQSSMTSLEGSSTLEHLPHKSPRCAGGPHVEEPWMTSPETDSGFVGSETSRVSPLTQTPEHRLSHISTPGRSTQCFTASAPHEGASHPKARDLVVPKRAAEPSTPRSRAQRHPSTLSSPLRQGTPVSRLEQALAADMVVPSSELKGQKRISEKLLPGRTISPAPTPVPAAASLPHGPAESTPNLFVTRTGRDQAIRDLQAEVSRLRLRLEDSLHQPCQGSPICSTSAFDRSARSRDRPVDSSVTWGSHCGSKSTERLSREPEGAEPAVPRGRQRARSSSVPREVPQLSLSSESESLSPQLSSEKSRIPKDHPWAARDGTKGAGSGKRSDRVSFRGQYTGQDYHVLSPKAVQKDSNTASCPHCQPIRVQDSGNAAAKDPLEPPATHALCCPLCGQIGSPAEGDGPSSVPSGTEKASTRRNAPPTSSPKQKSRRAGSPAQPPPGLWYLAAVPPAPAPPAFAYVSSVPIMPYPSATVYYVPPAPTSAPAASPRPAQRHRHSIQLNLDELDELQAALSQAARAAESVRSTTRQMRRSLAADLRQARDLRGSCLF